MVAVKVSLVGVNEHDFARRVAVKVSLAGVNEHDFQKNMCEMLCDCI